MMRFWPKSTVTASCMSTYKLAKRGKNHKRCPQNIETNPVLTGHEFAGIIVKVRREMKRSV